jgi:hypothetical protein
MVIHVDDSEEPVGYGRPPKHTRFKPGQSGNPKGRPKSSAPPIWQNPLTAMLLEPISVNVGGKVMTIPTYKAMLKRMANKALQGDAKTMQMFLKATNNFKSIIDEEKGSFTRADLEYVERVRASAAAWEAGNEK